MLCTGAKMLNACFLKHHPLNTLNKKNSYWPTHKLPIENSNNAANNL